MKNLLLIILFFGCSTFSFAQETQQDSVYVTAEIMPEYKDDGINGFRRFIAKNYIVPEGIQGDLVGTVIVSFVIEKDGEISTIKVLRDLGSGTGQAAIEAVRKSEKWSPGYINQKPVRVQFTLPINLDVIMPAEPLSDVFLAQETQQDSVYVTAEIMPEYKDDGINGFRRFIAKNYIVPEGVQEDLVGTVIVNFIVEKDGEISTIKVLRDLGSGTGQAAIEAVRKSEKWSPGYINQKPVRVQIAMPINLNIKMPAEPINPIESSLSMHEFIEMNGIIVYPKKPANNHTLPEYPHGGIAGFRKYITNGFKLPDYIKEAKGLIVVAFVVDETGRVVDAKVTKDIENTKGLSAEVVRLIKKSGKWKPATLNGKKIKVTYSLPIIFNISSNIIYESPGRYRVYNSNDFKNGDLRAPKEFGPK